MPSRHAETCAVRGNCRLQVYPGGNRLPPSTPRGSAHQISYIARGERTLETTAGPFDTQTQSWYFVSGLEVAAPDRVLGTVVALGDSITDGHASLTNANARWPTDLARRLNSLQGPR